MVSQVVLHLAAHLQAGALEQQEDLLVVLHLHASHKMNVLTVDS